MDKTVADTPKTNEGEQIVEITSTKRRLKRHFLKEAKRMRKSRIEYYAPEPNLFDFIREETARMETFFNWLDLTHVNLERIQKVCISYLASPFADCEEKKKLGDDFNELISFKVSLLNFRDLISEKAYHYSSLLNELDEVKAYRDSKAKAS